MPNFVATGETTAELWRLNSCQYDGCPPSWMFENLKIFTAGRVNRVNECHPTKFHSDWLNHCWEIAI